jgi:UDP-N-acetylmuramoyl-tripeptide--D-alanyl-D-alanine ligase
MKLDRLGLIGEWLGCSAKDIPITGFSFDSRDIEKGYLFFALTGAHFDGHDFLREVAKKGAVAAIVKETYLGETAGLILIRVKDVTSALQMLARLVQERRSQRVIAITGSVGKTTTKEFIATLLSQKYTVAKTPGNSNSQVGFPLAILRSSGEEEIFIAEMGMTHLHQIEKLVQIAPPELAVITKIGYSHVDTVPGGLEGVALAKSEILSHPSTKLAVIEYGAFQYPAVRNGGNSHKITYGVFPNQADVTLEAGWSLMDRGEESPTFRLPFSETHFLENFAGAAAVASVMGLSWEEILKGVSALKSIQNRFEKIDRDGVIFINDSYNASPESMKAALENLPKPSFGAKTLAVFGEMSTLGAYSEQGHCMIGEIALTKIDHLFCYGKKCMPMVELFNKAGRPVEFFRDLEELQKAIFELSKPGDVVLVKGSNSNKLWEIFN